MGDRVLLEALTEELRRLFSDSIELKLAPELVYELLLLNYTQSDKRDKSHGIKNFKSNIVNVPTLKILPLLEIV